MYGKNIELKQQMYTQRIPQKKVLQEIKVILCSSNNAPVWIVVSNCLVMTLIDIDRVQIDVMITITPENFFQIINYTQTIEY